MSTVTGSVAFYEVRMNEKKAGDGVFLILILDLSELILILDLSELLKVNQINKNIISNIYIGQVVITSMRITSRTDGLRHLLPDRDIYYI